MKDKELDLQRFAEKGEASANEGREVSGPGEPEPFDGRPPFASSETNPQGWASSRDNETEKAEEVLPAYVEKCRAAGEDPGIDVICVDPPRKGCDSKCLETILEIRPDRVVYVSCDPATLARDLRILTDGGYRLRKVRPVDQFGHTVHVETVVLLSRKAD